MRRIKKVGRGYGEIEVKEFAERIKEFNAGAIDCCLSEFIDEVYEEFLKAKARI